MKVFKIKACEHTMDKVAEQCLNVGGSLPGNFLCYIGDKVKRDFFRAWLDYLGIEYEITEHSEPEIKQGHLIADHVSLVTFTKRGGDC